MTHWQPVVLAGTTDASAPNVTRPNPLNFKASAGTRPLVTTDTNLERWKFPLFVSKRAWMSYSHTTQFGITAINVTGGLSLQVSKFHMEDDTNQLYRLHPSHMDHLTQRILQSKLCCSLEETNNSFLSHHRAYGHVFRRRYTKP